MTKEGCRKIKNLHRSRDSILVKACILVDINLHWSLEIIIFLLQVIFHQQVISLVRFLPNMDRIQGTLIICPIIIPKAMNNQINKLRNTIRIAAMMYQQFCNLCIKTQVKIRKKVLKKSLRINQKAQMTSYLRCQVRTKKKRKVTKIKAQTKARFAIINTKLLIIKNQIGQGSLPGRVSVGRGSTDFLLNRLTSLIIL